MKAFTHLKTFNTIITFVIAILAIYIILIPSLPDIVLALTPNEFQGYTHQSARTIEVLGEKAKELPQIPESNHLVIPKIHVSTPINEGADELALLELGMWHRPGTSTPDKGGNTVIAGHRYLHTKGPDTFYHLDKIALDDEILVYWEGEEYVYKVSEILEVYPHQIEIEYNTAEPIITLYTCIPLWTTEKRLAIIASLQ
jgi:LPXTG-site transpeptidase (sortase) family protein